MIDYAAIGQRVRALRRAAELTQEELAKQAGISASFLGHIERGSRILSVETLMALCVALSATPNELLGMEYASLSAPLPERATVSVPSLLQGVANLLKNLQLPE